MGFESEVGEGYGLAAGARRAGSREARGNAVTGPHNISAECGAAGAGNSVLI